MFEIVLFSKAAKFYGKLDDKTAKRVGNSIDRLKSDPFAGNNVKRLAGNLAGKYRLRVGDIRVVYFVEGQTVVIEAIDYRGNIY